MRILEQVKVLYHYWTILFSLLGAQLYGHIVGNMNIILLGIGFSWFMVVIGFGIEGYRLTFHLEDNYSDDYNEMLTHSTLFFFEEEIVFVSPNDTRIRLLINRMQLFFRFIPFGILIPLIFFLVVQSTSVSKI